MHRGQTPIASARSQPSGAGVAVVLLMGGQAAYRGAVAAYTVVMTVVLTQAEYGDFALAISSVAIAAALADGGVTWLLTREITLESSAPGALVRRLLTIRLAWAGGVCTLCAVGGVVVGARSGSDLAFVGVIVVAAFIEAIAGGYEAASLGAERPRRIAVGQVLAALLIAGGTALLFVAGASVVAAVAILAASSAIRSGILAFAWRGELRGGRLRTDIRGSREVLTRSLPFLVLIALGAIYYRADIVLLHAIIGSRETAEYAAAFRFIDVAIVFGGVLAGLLMPRMARAWRDDPSRLTALWRRAAVGVLVVSLPVVVVAMVFSHEIAGLVFGERYRSESGDLLRLLAPTITLMLLQSINAAVLFSSGRTRSLVGFTLVYVGVSVAATGAMAAVWGGPGAAVATTGSAAFTVAYLMVIVRRWSSTARPVTEAPLL